MHTQGVKQVCYVNMISHLFSYVSSGTSINIFFWLFSENGFLRPSNQGNYFILFFQFLIFYFMNTLCKVSAYSKLSASFILHLCSAHTLTSSV